ncbi:S9 family peptidase [Pseudonocardia pini]|uniref:S9 family peptidase n=1 Tax=Pseudonocardia pini TaxID=2758030 RepID=UPI0015F0C4A1|nr:prolyl oligopeptidase family serine peptidase [Pseudonocardia pini]
MSTESFPRLHARTRRFTLGAPRGTTVSPDGGRVVFLRSGSGTDPVTRLWCYEVETGEERLVVDPRELDPTDVEDLPPEERARRERSREQAGGIVSYATDRAVTRAVFPLSGKLYLTEFAGGLAPRLVETEGAVIDPRLDPTGARIAYVAGGALHVHLVAARTTTTLVSPESPQVTHGLADFAAAEEMGRMRGYWWSPDGERLAVARVDESPVRTWWIADPANPDTEPTRVAYPAAGTPNAAVSLEVVGLDGRRVPVPFDDEYLVDVVWDAHGLMVQVQPRDQRALRTLAVDPDTGATTVLDERTDPVWVEIVPGVPARTAAGTLVQVDDREGARRLVVGGEPVTPRSMQVRAVLGVDGETVLLAASDQDPTSTSVWTWSPAGLERVTPATGLHSGRLAGGTLVVSSTDLDTPGRTAVHAAGAVHELASHAVVPDLEPRVTLLRSGERELATALLLPSWWEPGTPLPVLMDPYGGPHAQRVVSARNAHLTSQWFAEQGFAVVVVDGRGTPGRGPEFERAVHLDLAQPVLDDQIDALRALSVEHPDLDLTRVGIRGWSFGGYLAALAVLRRPDVFHAAVAGAPVTDWALYDTHYTERYLGHPEVEKTAYERSSLFGDAAVPPSADQPNRPLLLVHGLADDNVVAAHTLRLSSALLAAGRAHEVLPLSGVTHMTPQEVVAENLLLLQVEFLKKALGVS